MCMVCMVYSVYGVLCMVYGVYGVWCVVYGVYGIWCMVWIGRGGGASCIIEGREGKEQEG